MAVSTSKKVVISRFDREPVAGFLNPQTSFTSEGVEVLTQGGALVSVPYGEIKVVCFVRDFEGPPFSQEKHLFQNRPKTEGLWVRAQFRDKDFLDGVVPNDLLHLDPHGFIVIPPDPFSNNQRIFLPRAALLEIRILGVVGSPLRKRPGKPEPRQQIGLFDDQT